jgi:hypothetical protein
MLEKRPESLKRGQSTRVEARDIFRPISGRVPLANVKSIDFTLMRVKSILLTFEESARRCSFGRHSEKGLESGGGMATMGP